MHISVFVCMDGKGFFHAGYVGVAEVGLVYVFYVPAKRGGEEDAEIEFAD